MFFLASCFWGIGLSASAQYNDKYVEITNSIIENEWYSVVKMSRKDNRVKVKYFAAKDYNGTSVFSRYNEWARNKNIIAYSSGTYMTHCEAQLAKPVGLCIDDGILVNNTIENNLDGLAIVYRTGGMVVSNLKDRNLTVKYADGTSKTLNIRNAFELNEFIDWAKENSATVFQTHLFFYKNALQVHKDGSQSIRERRFLAVGTNSDGSIMHYFVNLSGANTIYDATLKVTKFLKNREGINITFLINLDPGCQNVFRVYDSEGNIYPGKRFQGDVPISNAANLVVYYYE